MEELHAGGCACGAVRYRTLGKRIVATVGHCAFCRRRLTSAFALRNPPRPPETPR
ncbi:MAG TPA: hypothetical protein VFC18_11005 [Burkholderiales bacterium]|nr:hypothetical protein [Burkholderiales bacterium]